MVKQAGALIAPREVEEVVDRIIGVRLSAAVGLPNENTQAEELVVVVETRVEPPPEGLAAAVQAAVRAEVGVVPGRVLPVPAPAVLEVTSPPPLVSRPDLHRWWSSRDTNGRGARGDCSWPPTKLISSSVRAWN